MQKKTILITGATGGIGAELARQLLDAGHSVYMPVRNTEKARTLFAMYPNAYYQECNIENEASVGGFIWDIFKDVSRNTVFDYVILLAGDLRKDNDPFFDQPIGSSREQNSILYHERVNVRTAEAVIEVLKSEHKPFIAHTTVLGVSSWAAHFEPGHPYRKNEEGYVLAKAKLSAYLHDLKAKGLFKDVICEEPALIVTPLTEREFPELLADPSIQKLTSAQYVAHLRSVLDL